jgi:hypothetical protein
MAPKPAIKKWGIRAQETLEKVVGAISTKNMPEYKETKDFTFQEDRYKNMSNLNVLLKQS